MENKNSSSKSILKSQLFCRICGDIARGYNFDVITCMSCKAFFRRNARQASVDICFDAIFFLYMLSFCRNSLDVNINHSVILTRKHVIHVQLVA